LDGAAKIKDMVQRAGELNMPALAITDHGNLFGAVEFYKTCRAHGIKPILGMEAYIAPRERGLRQKVEGEKDAYHLVLLAKNNTGIRNLIKLSSIAFLEGVYYKPRIDFEVLARHAEGLIATSACMSGQIAHKLRTDRKDEAIAHAEKYLQLFGDDFYFEVQNHHIPDELAVYPKVYDLAREMGVKVVATNDTHYLHHGDDKAHDILICLQTGKDRDDPNRMRYGTTELYMKSPDEMFQVFKDKPHVLENTMEIFEKIDAELDFDRRLIPRFPIDAGEGDISESDYLRKLAMEGARRHYPSLGKEVVERMDYELGIIEKMGFAGYFLIVQDFINAARERDIPVGLGRGSAAGSLVAYSLGITDVDPLKYDLLFERFLNPERISMPDIDVDFCVERRDEVLEYVRDKYGRRNVAQIITFGTMGSKSVVRDVSRVLKVPLQTADAIAKMIPLEGNSPIPLKRAFEEVPELKELTQNDDPVMRELVEYSMTLEGIARHNSTHAAGVIIAPTDITDYAPLCKSSQGDIVTQWTMGYCEEVGLLKMDFLGLRNLTVIKKAVDMIRERHDPEFDIRNIPLDDEKTFELYGKGLTTGVFQFESSGMQEYLKKLKPSRVEDLIAMNALYRPGPMDLIDDFIDRKYGRKEIHYLHPKLEPILKETYGIMVYQEQVMRIVSDLAGFTLAEADLMRRAMGKKKADVMQEQRQKFIDGCVANEIDKKTAASIFDHIEKFARYGFNKSHSAAYALISYQTAYLKAHYTAEFMAANLTSEITKLDRVKVLMSECNKMGIKINPPDINYSVADFKPLDAQTIAFGMAAIKNVGGNAIRSLVAEREENGKFETLFDVTRRVDLRQVNKKVLEGLALAGALDSLKGNRAQLFMAVETAIDFGQSVQSRLLQNKDQISLFGEGGDGPTMEISEPPLPDVPDWDTNEKLKKELEMIGFYISGHPLDDFLPIVNLYSTDLTPFTHSDEKTAPTNGQQTPRVLYICGQITGMRTRYDSKNQKMAFVQIKSYDHDFDAVVFSSVFPQCEPFLKQGQIVYVKAGLNGDLNSDTIRIRVDAMYSPGQVPAQFTESMKLTIPGNLLTNDTLYHLKLTFASVPGTQKVYWNFDLSPDAAIAMRSAKNGVKLTLPTLQKLADILGYENIHIKRIERG